MNDSDGTWEWLATVPSEASVAILWVGSLGHPRLAIAVPSGTARGHGQLPVLEAMALLSAQTGKCVALASAGVHDNWLPGCARIGFCTFFFDIMDV